MNEREFAQRVEAVDERLARQDVPPAQRVFPAFRDLVGDYSGPIMGFGVNPSDYPDFVGPNLFERISSWYDDRYGDRMGVGSMARIPLLIRGTVYFAEVPLAYGEVKMTLEDILGLIEGLTPSLTQTLSRPELLSIGYTWKAAYELVYEMDDCRGSFQSSEELSAVFESARTDLEAAADSLRGRASPATSLFHSQQLAEKMLKTLAVAKNVCGVRDLKKFGHDLARICKACCSKCPEVIAIAADVVVVGRVTMDIRYSSPDATTKDAVETLWAALRVAGTCACLATGSERRYDPKPAS